MATKQRSKQEKGQHLVARWYTPGSSTVPGDKAFISGPDLRELIAGQLGKKLSNRFSLYLADGDYYCPPVDDAREIIAASKVDRKTWVAEKFDCDDFAHVLKAHFAEAAYKNGLRRKPHCFGVVWGMLPGPHAINWMVNADMRLRFVEPQDDRVFLPRSSDRDIYFMMS